MLTERPTRLRHIVITGGGVTGWMAAAALARLTEAGATRITLVDDGDSDLGAVTAGPGLKDFHALVSVDEHEMLAAADGTMRLASEIVDPAVPYGRFLQAFGDFGLDVAGVPILQLWLRAGASGPSADLNDFNLAAVAARLGRFARPAPDKRTMIDHGYQLDGRLYARFMRRLAEARGVIRLTGLRAGVEHDPVSGSIVAARLDDGRTVSGDFFIDCSLVPDAAPDDASEDLSGLFPCSRTVEIETAPTPDLPPVDRVEVCGSGWLHTVRLQRRTLHHLSHVTEIDGEAALRADRGLKALGPARHAACRSRRRHRCWSANSVALGAAAFSADPTTASELDSAAAGIAALIALLPDQGNCVAEANAFNRQMRAHFEAFRDMALLRRVTVAAGVPVLRGATEGAVLPSSLLERIELFSGRGRISGGMAGQYSPAYWLGALHGRGLLPTSWDVRADAVAPARTEEAFARLAGLIRQSAESMPRHADYILRHCAATTPR